MDFNSFKKSEKKKGRRESWDKSNTVVKKVTSKILNFYTYNNRWYINILYLGIFSALCLNTLNGDTNIFGFSDMLVNTISITSVVFIISLKISVIIYALGLVFRILFFIVKKFATI